jgi:hypothetical protein
VLVVAENRTRVVETSGRTPKVFDQTFATPMRLLATSRSAALISSELGSSVLTCDSTGITMRPLKPRGVPSAAAIGAGHFLLAMDSGIEEWDSVSLISRRHLRLPRPMRVRALGGTRRTVWFIGHETPARIDAIVLIAMNQPKVHELPEPIAQIAAHPELELVWCLGAASGRVYLVDLEGRSKPRIVAEGVEALGVGNGDAVTLVVARAGHPVEISTTSSAGAVARRSSIGRAPGESTPVADPDPAKWRDVLVEWTRRGDAMGAPISAAIAAIGERFALRDELLPAIALCYGAHLCGEPGVPLVDITLVLGGLWDEALGRGELASKGMLVIVESRARLSSELYRALDER